MTQQIDVLALGARGLAVLTGPPGPAGPPGAGINVGQYNATLINGLNSNVNTTGLGVVRIGGPTAAFSIDGIVAPSVSQPNRIVLWNTTAYAMTIVDKGTSVSSAGNKIATIRAVNVSPVLRGGSSCEVTYDSTLAAWVLTASGYVGEQPFNPKDYGAAFDGSTDDTAAWVAMFAAIAAAGGGYVFVPPGVSIVKPTIDGQRLFTVPSNTRIEGYSWNSQILVSASTTANYYTIFGNAASVSGITVRNLYINQNPQASNAKPNGTQYAIQFGDTTHNVTDLIVDSCKFLHCGSNCINVYGPSSSGLKVNLCTFTFQGCGTVSYDNSGIYLHGGHAITNNTFIAPAIPANGASINSTGAAFEMHLGPGVASNNVVYNYFVGANVVGADSQDAPGTVGGNYAIGNNQLNGVNFGFQLWALHVGGNDYTLANVTISGNTINLDQNSWFANSAYNATVAGTAHVTNGSTSVTGTGTTWNTSGAGQLTTGQYVQFASQLGTNYVVTVVSDTSLTLSAAYSGTSASSTQVLTGGGSCSGVTLLPVNTDIATTSLYDNIHITGNTITYKNTLTNQTPAGSVYGSAGVWLGTAGTFQNVTVSNNRISHSPGTGVYVGKQNGTTTCKNLTIVNNTLHNIGTDTSAIGGVQRAGIWIDRVLSTAYIDGNISTYDASYPSSAQTPYAAYVNPASAAGVYYGTHRVTSAAASGGATPGFSFAAVTGLIGLSGATRPVTPITGQQFYDTTLNAGAGAPIVWNGTNWKNYAGATV